MSLYAEKAVVLRTWKLGEADRILSLLTETHGKVRAVAKGVRKSTSRIGGRLEPFSIIDVRLWKGTGELQRIAQVDLVHGHSALHSDFLRLSLRKDFPICAMPKGGFNRNACWTRR